MIIYRIENKQMIGPYRWFQKGLLPWTNKEKHDDFSKYPDFIEDNFPILEDIDKYVFGFDSKDKLKYWFTDRELKSLKNCGFYINYYEIDSNYVIYGKSNKQIMFKQNKAELIFFNINL